MAAHSRGDSDGQFDFFTTDTKDGYDSVEWLAKQPWCTGKVGSFGGSQGGYSQNFLAATRPPHLVAQYLTDFGVSLFHDGYCGGGVVRPTRFLTRMANHARDFETHFVAESPDKLRRLPRYYAAQLGQGEFPAIACNAPWVSAVIEADGNVRPCYFHEAVGNTRETSLRDILGNEMNHFRAQLDVHENATCKKCVCTLKVGMRTKLW